VDDRGKEIGGGRARGEAGGEMGSEGGKVRTEGGGARTRRGAIGGDPLLDGLKMSEICGCQRRGAVERSVVYGERIGIRQGKLRRNEGGGVAVERQVGRGGGWI